MLKIKDNVDLKELEKFEIYPRYIVNENTGETLIKDYTTFRYSIKGLKLKKVRKPRFIGMFKDYLTYQYILCRENFDETDYNLLYDLIKADLVEKVSDE